MEIVVVETYVRQGRTKPHQCIVFTQPLATGTKVGSLTPLGRLALHALAEHIDTDWYLIREPLVLELPLEDDQMHPNLNTPEKIQACMRNWLQRQPMRPEFKQESWEDEDGQPFMLLTVTAADPLLVEDGNAIYAALQGSVGVQEYNSKTGLAYKITPQVKSSSVVEVSNAAARAQAIIRDCLLFKQ